jgi:cyanate permease
MHQSSEAPLRLFCGRRSVVGRFVSTPILPSMIDALGWSSATAGLVASANFLGYLVGALTAGLPIFSSAPRRWLFHGLAVSAISTAPTGFFPDRYCHFNNCDSGQGAKLSTAESMGEHTTKVRDARNLSGATHCQIQCGQLVRRGHVFQAASRA